MLVAECPPGSHSEADLHWNYVAPGKPQQNRFVENFNGKLHQERLNEEVFATMAEARIAIERIRSNNRSEQRSHPRGHSHRQSAP
jgi:hypothetical protein